MVFDANCKINIGLNILNRRNDGFHDLSTIMYPVKGLYDMVEVVKSDKLKFTSSGLKINCDAEDNLCVRAYNLIKEELQGEIPPLHIHLHKIVPFGAGLGGGSSNATFTLIAINELLELNLSNEKLKDLASKLGSDTAFFVDNTPQLCLSRGEVTTPIGIDLRGFYLTIVKPDIFVSTKEAFSGIVPAIPTFNLCELPNINLTNWRDIVKNDFENTLFNRYQELSDLKNKLYDYGAIYASMSGSGSALYSISDHEISDEIAKNGCFYFSCVIK